MGKIEIDHTGSGGGVTLSSDGTSLLLDGTAIGGGGTALELYAENPSSPTAPSATGTNAVAIGNTVTASGNESISVGPFSSATAYAASSFGTLAVAAGAYSVALGKSRAGGSTSLSAIIDSTSSSYGATGANSVAIGKTNKAQSTWSSAIGGSLNIASDTGATVTGGYTNTASGLYSRSGGKDAKSDKYGKDAWASGKFSAQGDAQSGTFVLRSDTADATPEAMTTNNSTAGTTNQIILPNNSAYAFHGTIVARQQASQGTACAAWKIEGLIRREGSAGTTVLVNSATTVLDNTPAWGMALSADTTNGGLKIEVTGAAATNIRWVATINTSEVTY